MAFFECKMCGGTIKIEQGAGVGVCEYCGMKQTLPRLDDDKKVNLYERAGHFRRNNDFDKAMAVYEAILNEDNTDAEAYWSLVLCRYGIEYVEDPGTRRRVPTVNRAQFTSIYMDENYRSAIQYADIYQKAIYEAEAKAIDEIQKGILAISAREEPFDVFICYKETDKNGRRTPDSVLANELYHQLTAEGFKVFFSRITLEDKLGIAYEPYIFAALNSSKVMVVIGTKPEYFNAVWVKNEWSRYLALVKNSGGKKMLIPAYRDMDPYDLPEEFSHLQAQDMSRLGFMQDLIRGIKKIAQAEAPKQIAVKETVVTGTGSSASTAPLLKRAFMFLEDEEWQDADAYCEKVLDLDPENALAYLGKLMAELRVSLREKLRDFEKPFDGNGNYKKIMRFGDKALQDEMQGYIAHIRKHNDNAKLIDIYREGKEAMKAADTEKKYEKAAGVFQSISGFKDADALAGECLEKAKEARRASEKNVKKRKKILIIGAPIVCVCMALVIVFTTAILPKYKLSKAMNLIEAGDYDPAYAILEELGKNEAIASKKYDRAIELIDSGDYEPAYMLLKDLGYKDSEEKLQYIKKQHLPIQLREANIGNTVYFGTYEQDNDTSNGKEDIAWIVLAKEDNKALVISEKGLDCQPYHTSRTNVTWESCSLRQWLNESFFNETFSMKEKTVILSNEVSADKILKYTTDPGNATTDKVFLLSITEAEKYLALDDDKQCKPTKQAVANGAYVSDRGNCWWWLRSPGTRQYYATRVKQGGSVDGVGRSVADDTICVRPAMWISLDA